MVSFLWAHVLRNEGEGAAQLHRNLCWTTLLFLLFLVGLFLTLDLSLYYDLRDFYCNRLSPNHCGEMRFSDFDPKTAEILQCPVWLRVMDKDDPEIDYWCPPADCLVSNHVIKCSCQDPEHPGEMKTPSMLASFASNDYCLQQNDDNDA